MFWLYLITDRAGSRAVLRSRAEEGAPPEDATAILVGLGGFEDAREAVGALARLETRLARVQRRVRPSLPGSGSPCRPPARVLNFGS